MGLFGSVLGGTLRSLSQLVFQAAAAGITDAAAFLLHKVGDLMLSSTSLDLGSKWFTDQERVMAVMAAVVVLPMACCGVVQAVYRQDASMLVRNFLVKLPMALLATGVAVELVRLGLALTDDLSGYVLHSASGNALTFFDRLSQSIGGPLLAEGVPVFVVFAGAVLIALACLALWVELAVRAAAVAAATLFLPLALAGLVWPATSHWCRRLADTLAALVLSKLVVAAVLSLAAAALAGAMSSTPGAGPFADVVLGVALLAMATMSPFMLLRLVPAIEAGAVLHLESARHQLQHAAMAPQRTANLAMQMEDGAGWLGGGSAAASGGGTTEFDPSQLTEAGSGLPQRSGETASEDLVMQAAGVSGDHGAGTAEQDQEDGGDGGG